jgi:hypothetical protein
MLSQLPELPDSLINLNCGDNPGLISLPELPDSLIDLNCGKTFNKYTL